MDVTNSRSLLAAPLLLNGEVIGAVLITKYEPNHYSYDNYKLLQVLSAHLGLAMSNATLHAKVRKMVITDNLTGLYARHYLNERIGRKQLRDNSGSLIVVDIDHFKKINDTYGHQVGDDILIQVSGIIRSSIRDSDIAARWGGEELAIYLPLLGLEKTERVAERIRQRVETETNPQVTVSCGISEWRLADEKVSVESLFYKADMALYEAKHQGRNCIVVG
jgi:diguanylate cyclase (GGDEF)-like protein